MPQRRHLPHHPIRSSSCGAVATSRCWSMGAIIGVPIATFAFFFLKGVTELQQYVFTTLPSDLGFNGEPVWWPLPWLALSGLLGRAGDHLPPRDGRARAVGGLQVRGPGRATMLPGIFFAALATLGFGAVLGPEAPLIALGSGLGVLILHLVKRERRRPWRAIVIGAAGSFAAISTLLGSPITGAFLLMEVAGLAGPMLGIVLTPGLVAAGVGSLIFVGLDSWTGFGTFGLAVPNIPSFGTPDLTEFLWALAIGVLAALVGTLIRRRLGLPRADRRPPEAAADARGRAGRSRASRSPSARGRARAARWCSSPVRMRSRR